MPSHSSASVHQHIHPLQFIIASSSSIHQLLHKTQLVIGKGFEPLTHSLEGCCSIQLSYQTIIGFVGAKIGIFSIKQAFLLKKLLLLRLGTERLAEILLLLGRSGRFRSRFRLGARFLHLKFVAHEHRLVSLHDGLVSFAFNRHFNKAITLRTTRFVVHDDFANGHRTILLKEFPEVV